MKPNEPDAWEGMVFAVHLLRDIVENVVLDLEQRFPGGPHYKQ